MPGRKNNSMTNQLNREAVIKAAADQNYLERWRWTIDHVYVGSCPNDWKCTQGACSNFNDSSSIQCSGVGCQTARPKHWRPCGVSFPLATRRVLMTVGDGGSKETVLQPSQADVGSYNPVDKRNQLQVSKHADVEKMFGIKMLVVDTLDHTSGNYVCFHTQMFTNSTIATALDNGEPVLNQAVEITYNAETLSTTPNNIQVRVVLVPTEKIPSCEIPVNTANPYMLGELLLNLQQTNDALTEAYPGCIQLDNSEMAPSHSPDTNLKNVNRPLKAHKRMNPTLVDELMRLAAKQDVKESIENEGRVLRYGDALFELSIALLTKKRIELFVAGKNNTAVDCVAALQKEFPSDGSNARQFFKTIMRTGTENFTAKNEYAYDERVCFVGGRCPITGKKTMELKTTPDGEDQRDACTPNALRYIRKGRESFLKSISTRSTQVDVFNESYREVENEGDDCEDGSEQGKQIANTFVEVNAQIDAAESDSSYSSYLQQTGSRLTLALQNMLRPRKSTNRLSKIDIYQRCVGNIVDEITSNKGAYTEEERDDLRKGICMLWMHMSEAFRNIDQISRPMTGLWFAGGASQTLQTTEQSNQNENEADEVISFDSEMAKFQKVCASCAGHAAPCIVSVDETLAEQQLYNKEHELSHEELGCLRICKQYEEAEPFETTALYNIDRDDANANSTVKTTVFCENEADAMQLQQEECIGQMFGKKDAHDVAGNYTKCLSSWTEITKDNAQQAGNGACVTTTPCVPKKQSMDFYKGILHASLYDTKTQKMAPGVTVDTANKLARKSHMNANGDNGGSDDLCTAVAIFDGSSNPKLAIYAKVQKAWADTNDPGAVQSRRNSMNIRGPSVWKPLKLIGNGRGIDTYSQNCVTLRIKGALTQEQCGGVLDSENVMHKAAQLTVAEHMDSLDKVSEKQWGVLFLQRSTLESVFILKANAYPKRLHDVESSAQTIPGNRVQGKRWNFLAQQPGDEPRRRIAGSSS